MYLGYAPCAFNEFALLIKKRKYSVVPFHLLSKIILSVGFLFNISFLCISAYVIFGLPLPFFTASIGTKLLFLTGAFICLYSSS
jgi:hypothetical protein